MYIHMLNLPENYIMELECVTIHEFKDGFHTEAPEELHTLNMFCPWQVPMSTTLHTDTQATPHTPTSSQ